MTPHVKKANKTLIGRPASSSGPLDKAMKITCLEVKLFYELNNTLGGRNKHILVFTSF